MVKKITILMLVAATVLSLPSCNSNDDDSGIYIEGITLTDDVDCCSAEEALRVYKFLQTVKIIPELSTVVDGKYNVFVYSRTGRLHRGYNDLYFVATKKTTGNYIRYFELTGLTPLMYMVKMDKTHSTPVGASVETLDEDLPALKHGWVSLLMNTSEEGSWTFSYDIQVLESKGGIERVPYTVDALPDGQDWLKSFKVGEDTYYLSLVNPTDWKTGANTIEAYVSKKSSPMTVPYALATEAFTIELDPRMPDMGHHTSPDNNPLTQQADGAYRGTINVTMTGLWRIHLTVRDKAGNMVAGGDDLKDGFSSLFWDVTL